MKIKSIQLLNFQSWSNDSPSINLDTDVTNIIEGPNETGKSVLFKVMYNMIFPGYWSSTELIRRGFTTGIMLLTLADESLLAYTLEGSHYTLILQEGERETTWTDYKMVPKEIVSKLGLIVDYSSKIILNIIDKDVPLPFIKTSPVFNASLLKSIVEPIEMTEFFERSTEQQTLADKGRQYFSQKAEQARSAAYALPQTDETLLQMRIENVSNVLETAKKVDPFYDSLAECITIQQHQPLKVINPEPVVPKLKSYDAILETNLIILKLTQYLSKKPLEIRDPSVILPELSLFDTITNIVQDMQSVIQRCQQRPKMVSSPCKVDDSLTLLDSTMSLLSQLASVCSIIVKCPKPVIVPDISAEISVLDTAREMHSALVESGKLSIEIRNLNLKGEKLLSELEQMRSTYGVCPTCGRLLEEVH